MRHNSQFTGSFRILPAKITNAKGAAKTYNGKAQKTTWTVKAGKLSVPASGFKASGYKANKNAGTAKATISGTGKAVKPALAVKAGGVRVPGSGYTASWSNNTKVGTATVSVAGKGNFKGSAKTTFRIVAPTVVYKGHTQTTGWEKSWKRNGQLSGTTGKAQRLEGICVKLANGCPVSGGIQYRAKVQGKGWETWKKNGQLCGTTGQGKYMEAICIELTGKMKTAYNVYYRVYVQNFGWLGWAKDGVKVGTVGYNDRIEAIQIVLVPKGGKAPTPTYKGEHQWLSKSLVKK